MGKKQYGMSGQREIENNYKKGRCKKGNLVYIPEGNEWKEYEVIQVIDKVLYNMYICERNEYGHILRSSITDKDKFIIVG